MTHRWRRLWVGAAFAVVAILGPNVASAPGACASGETAGLVVRDSQGAVTQECVPIAPATEDPIGLLKLAGHRVTTKDYGGSLGALLCTIDGDGTAVGACPGNEGHWHLWIWSRTEPRWVESQLGASSTTIRSGDVVGWTWERNDTVSAPPAPNREARCDDGVSDFRSAVPGPGRPERGAPAFVPLALVGVAATALVVIAIKRRGADR